MAVAGEAGKEEEEPHCDVMEALTGCWGVGRANLVVWRDGAGQNCQRVASVEEERAGKRERNKQTKILPPKPPVREAEATWGQERGGQGL